MPLTRRLHTRLARSQPLVLAHSAAEPGQIVVAVDALTPSSCAAVVAPALRLASEMPVTTLVPASLVAELPEMLCAWTKPAGEAPAELGVVLSTSPHMAAGAHALQWARARAAPYLVAQHGAITPYHPPLPDGIELLAWTAADANLWTSRCATSTRIVGSQLLWEASRASLPITDTDGSQRIFLGQLHGLELDRTVTIATVEALAADGPLTYRPHPAERDRRSRAQHKRWQRAGIAIDDSGASLATLKGAVIGIYSTGLLEAAAAGRPAWGACALPIEWVRDFWGRYSVGEWGAKPRAALPVPEREPALAIAERTVAALAEPRR